MSELIGEDTIPDSLRWRGKVYALVGLAGLALVVTVFATTLGSVHIPFSTCFQVLLSQVPFLHIVPSSPEVFGMTLDVERLEMIILNGYTLHNLSVVPL